MHVAVTAVGTDRPGIVAAVTQALFGVGANLEDSRMALLGGHFALVVIAALPEGADAASLREALGGAERDFDLLVNVGVVPDLPAGHADAEPWVISVYGADRPGIVAGISRALAEHAVNITDLATHVAGNPPVYVMILEATLPAGADPRAIRAALDTLAADLGVDVAMNPMEPETL